MAKVFTVHEELFNMKFVDLSESFTLCFMLSGMISLSIIPYVDRVMESLLQF